MLLFSRRDGLWKEGVCEAFQASSDRHRIRFRDGSLQTVQLCNELWLLRAAGAQTSPLRLAELRQAVQKAARTSASQSRTPPRASLLPTEEEIGLARVASAVDAAWSGGSGGALPLEAADELEEGGEEGRSGSAYLKIVLTKDPQLVGGSWL